MQIYTLILCLIIIVFTNAELIKIYGSDISVYSKPSESPVGYLTEDSTVKILSQIRYNLVRSYYKGQKCFTHTKDETLRGLDFQQFEDMAISVIDLRNISDDLQRLMDSYENHCDWFIVETSNSERFIEMILSILKKSYHRVNPRIIFFPAVYNETDDEEAQKIFSMTTNYLPDVLVISAGYNSDSGLILHFKTGDWLNGESVTLYTCNLVECNVTEKDLFPDKLQQLNRKKLRCATFHYPPYAFLEPKIDGTEYRLYDEFARIYNCTFTVSTYDGMWGEINEDGTGNGILGNVYKGEADFGYGALYLWYNEYQYLDFAAPYIRTGVTCLVPKVQQVSSWLLPLLPFDTTLWALVISTLVLSVVTLYYTAKVANQFSSNWRMRFRTISDSVIRVIGLIVLQTPTAKGIRPPPLPLRYIITWLEVTFLLIVTSYHSGLATTLTVHRYEEPIATIQDLVDSKLPWGNSHDAWIFSIRLSQETNTKILLQRFQNKDDSFLKRHVKKRDFAFSIERLESGFFAVGDFVTTDSIPYIQLMKEDIYYEFVVSIMPKSSPYREKINLLINRIHNAGLLKYWEEEMARRYLSLEIQNGIAHSNVIETDLEPASLQMKQIYGNLIILTVGYFIASITFVLENLWYRRKQRQSKIELHENCT